MIPLVDLKAQLVPIRGELDDAVRQVIDDAAFVLGPAVDRFEKAFASFIGVRHCVGVQSGTAALQLALLTRGIGAGDEVITVPSTFFATAEAISLTGATPVFVDVEADTLNLDVNLLERAITPRTRCIVPVHLFGQAANMDPILAVAKKHDIAVIEDACQAHGATYRGARAGSLGLAAAFSFYPGKNLGAFGEGGAITTNDDEIARSCRLLRDHGSPEKYQHRVVGYNYRMEGINGAVLSVKLPYLERWNEARRRLAHRYTAALAGIGDLQLPVERDYGVPVYHLYAVRSAHRNRIFERFEKSGVSRAVHYPIPIHLQDAYRHLRLGPGSYPVAEAAAAGLFSLPLYPELSERQQDTVIGAVMQAFNPAAP